jgi:hypothetical protein
LLLAARRNVPLCLSGGVNFAIEGKNNFIAINFSCTDIERIA